MIRIALNGLGRIGKIVLRDLIDAGCGGEIVLLNDPIGDAEQHALLMEFDSVHGRWRTPVAAGEGALVLNGKTIRLTHEKTIEALPLAELGVDLVIDCTGVFKTEAKLAPYFDAGVKKVVVSAPVKDGPTANIVFGVNHEILKASDVIVSAGSCTTNSMAAMVKLLDENWGIKAGFMTTIHAYTGTQMILDGPRFPKARNNRAAAINTIPHSTGAAKAIGKVVPSVNGKLQGHAQRIQVPDGSVTELTTVLNKEVTADEINAAFKAAFSDTDFYGYNEDGIVSSDIIGDTHGGVFDPTQTDVNTVDGLTMARTVSWYDNEYGFTCNMVRTLLYFAEISE